MAIPKEIEIAKAIMNWRLWRCQDIAAINNASICYNTTTKFNVADVFTINKSRYLYEFEIKRTIPDLKADKKKKEKE